MFKLILIDERTGKVLEEHRGVTSFIGGITRCYDSKIIEHTVPIADDSQRLHHVYRYLTAKEMSHWLQDNLINISDKIADEIANIEKFNGTPPNHQ